MRTSLLALLAILVLETSAFAVEKIRIGFPDLAAPFVPLAIADKRGFFQDEGLQGEFIRINPAIAFQALVGGEIDYYTVLGPGVAAAIRGESEQKSEARQIVIIYPLTGLFAQQ